MSKLKIVSIVTILVLSLNLNATEDYPKIKNIEESKILNNSELSKIFKPGNTIIGTNLKWEKEVIQNYYKDGFYNGSVASGKKKISGKWAIENNMICHSPKNKNKRKCRTIYKDGDYFLELNKNKMILKFKVKTRKWLLRHLTNSLFKKKTDIYI